MEPRPEHDWMAHYRLAMLELDLSVLGPHIHAAEQAIKERKRAIHQQPGSRNKCRP
jgi:SRSO17 transposase